MARRKIGKDISGVLVLDKPQGISSSAAVQKSKRLLSAKKVGHTGALDPLATGILPLCFGEATKFSQYLLNSDKKYAVQIKLGVSTNTGDADGEIIEKRSSEGIDEEKLESALVFFRGEVDQVPSMFSAIKHNGQPLYKLARQGIEVDRPSRRINIYSNELKALHNDILDLEIHCSKGTYIRTIAQELGDMLGCGAHVISLRRTMAGPYTEQDLVSFDQLEDTLDAEGALDALLLPISSAVHEWPQVKLSESTAYYIRQGQAVIVPHAPTSGWVRLEEIVPDSPTRFIGVGEILDDGRVAPRRMVSGG
tara:strand:- start:534 stop:1457 length:924 start_codon:yes stop_codon:yes gene_type:complete